MRAWTKAILRRRPSPAMLVAMIALTISLGGTSYAVTRIPLNSVGAPELRDNAVRSDKVRNGSLLTRDFKAGQLPAATLSIRDQAGGEVAPGQTGSATVECAQGERAVGGGAGFAGDPNPGNRVVESRPSSGEQSGGGTPTRWRATMYNGGAGGRTAVSYVICSLP